MQMGGCSVQTSSRLCGNRCGSLAQLHSPYCWRCERRRRWTRLYDGYKLYAIHGGGLITFGQTAIEIERRFAALQASSPISLTLIGCCRLPKSSEGRVHRLLRHFRVRGEWFRPEGHVLKVAAWLADGDRQSILLWMHAAEAARSDPIFDH